MTMSSEGAFSNAVNKIILQIIQSLFSRKHFFNLSEFRYRLVHRLGRFFIDGRCGSLLKNESVCVLELFSRLATCIENVSCDCRHKTSGEPKHIVAFDEEAPCADCLASSEVKPKHKLVVCEELCWLVTALGEQVAAGDR